MLDSVKQAIKRYKLITIVRGVDKEKLESLAQAMYDGEIRLLEITYDASGAVSDEETAQSIRQLSESFEGRLIIGAGTVLTEKQVELTCSAGGKFIISPDTNEAVIKQTKRLGLISIPGALTPSEAQRAHLAGADFVKLFPITNLGVKYVKAIKAPLSHIDFLAVGGINENNMKEYLDAGISGFGVGANIVNKELLEKNDYRAIASLAEKYASVVNG